MKKFWISLLAVVTLGFSGALQATEIIPMPDQVNPHSIKVDKTRLYITSGATIFIYSIPQYQLIKTFGKEGMGPGEFNSYTDTGVQLDVQSDLIFVNSQNRVSYFSKTGEYIREKRVSKGWWHMPLKDGSVGLSTMQEEGMVWRSVNIYNRSFNLVKRIGRKPLWYQQGRSIDPTDVRPPRFCVYKNRAYVENPKGVVDIFDATGNHLFSTNHTLERGKVSEADKEEYHNYYRTHRVYKTQYHNLKHLIKFPDFYPAIKYFDVVDNNIYVFTYVFKRGKSQLLIFDLNGQLKKTLYLSMPEINARAVFPLVAVGNSKVYQLIENPDTEEMELHITPIPNYL